MLHASIFELLQKKLKKHSFITYEVKETWSNSLKEVVVQRHCFSSENVNNASLQNCRKHVPVKKPDAESDAEVKNELWFNKKKLYYFQSSTFSIISCIIVMTLSILKKFIKSKCKRNIEQW